MAPRLLLLSRLEKLLMHTNVLHKIYIPFTFSFLLTAQHVITIYYKSLLTIDRSCYIYLLACAT